MTKVDPDIVHSAMAQLCRASHANAVKKGFWAVECDGGPRVTPDIIGSKIALMHSELSEALESARNSHAPDDKLPEMPGTLVEMADCVIRICDLVGAMGWDLGRAITEKMAYNANRPYKHGKVM